MKVVGITGKAGSGKSSLAELFEEQGYVRKSFADPLKWVAKRYFFWDGKKDMRGRQLLQMLGTDVGRAYDKNTWVKHMEKTIGGLVRVKNDIKIIIDDVRFPNEKSLINDLDGYVLQITGKAYDMGELNNHASEQDIQGDILLNIPDMGSKEAFKQEAFKGLQMLGLLNNNPKKEG